MATCAQQWKTADIRKRKPAGRLHAENKQQDCGAPPPPGKCWRGLNTPILSAYNKVMGATTDMLSKENRKKRHSRQEEQGPQSHWSTHKENFCCQMSYHHMESIEIIYARRVWQFITPPMKIYWIMRQGVDLSRMAAIGPRKKSTRQL